MKSISLYRKADHKRSKETIPIDIFFENIKSGYWKNIVDPIRLITDKKLYTDAKLKTPMVTLSGVFNERFDNQLLEHSGYIGIDIDDCDPDEVKSLLCPDKYVAAAFTSIGGKGLCVVFKINPKKHREAFAGISEYLYNNYKIVIDPTSVNESRARFVSFDPDLYDNIRNVVTFTFYPKAKQPKRIEKVIYVNDDFNFIMDQIIGNQVNITQDSYHVWLRIGFALVHKFGESGRHYFHTVSQYSSKYDPHVADKQFDACYKHRASNKLSTISTFYYYCKEAGLQIYSERTRKIAHSAIQGKKAGLGPEQIAENLRKFEDIVDNGTPEKGQSIIELINTIIENDIHVQGDTIIDQLEMFIRQNYSLMRNDITRYIENNETILHQKDINSIYIRAKKVFDLKVTYDLVERLINSDFVESYNPIIEWFNNNGASEIKHQIQFENTIELSPGKINIDFIQRFPQLTNFFSSINAVNNIEALPFQLHHDHEFADYYKSNPDIRTINPWVLYFGVKWFVGAISAVYGQHSPLMFVNCGAEQNTGKTEFFRRMLPDELKKYYAESKLDREKDDEILMTQKWFIMDDEMGGKSKKEETRLKELTSKQVFSLREPYGKNNVDLVRLAVLCGTSNTLGLLNDPTGNRRIIPANVSSINFALYNRVNKSDLIMEAFKLYAMGFNWQLNKQDIEYLGTDKQMFEALNSESELIMKYFEPGSNQLTATDIKVYMEQFTHQRLSLDKIGKELQRLGFEQQHVKYNGKTTKRVYMIGYTMPPESTPIARTSAFAIGHIMNGQNPAMSAINDIINRTSGSAENGQLPDVASGFKPIHREHDLPF